MNLVFMNSLERKVTDDLVKTAQVSICEDHGRWHVLWNEADEQGNDGQSCWFEGTEWSAMLQSFRQNLQEKLRDGYTPLLEGYGEGAKLLTARGRETQKLYYYSELHRNEEVFNQLRQWRKTQAAKEGRSAYMIASNRILEMISAFLPHNMSELKQIIGFGENRASVYGKQIIEITGDVARSTDFPLHWVANIVDEQQFELWYLEQIRLKQQNEETRKEDKIKLLKAISQGVSLSAMEKLLLMRRRDIVQSVEELVKEGYDVDAFIESELNIVDIAEQEQVQQLFQSLGDRYLKPVLTKLYNEEQLKEKDLDKTYEWMRLLRIKYRKQTVVS